MSLVSTQLKSNNTNNIIHRFYQSFASYFSYLPLYFVFPSVLWSSLSSFFFNHHLSNTPDIIFFFSGMDMYCPYHCRLHDSHDSVWLFSHKLSNLYLLNLFGRNCQHSLFRGTDPTVSSKCFVVGFNLHVVGTFLLRISPASFLHLPCTLSSSYPPLCIYRASSFLAYKCNCSQMSSCMQIVSI